MPRLKSDTPFPSPVRLSELEHGFEWSGQLSVAHMKRLQSESAVGNEVFWVSVSVQQGQSNLLWLTLQVQGTLIQICQRCLEHTGVELQLDLRAALISDESMLAHLDEEDESIVIEEMLDSEGMLNLLGLIEDECLLELPSSARHEDCKAATLQAGDVEDVVPPNPFAKLAELKS